MSTLQQTGAQDPAAGAVFRKLQKAARKAGEVEGRKIPTEEYLVRHALESFLARLNQTPHGQEFVLKGGILLAAYGIRRPTKDVDAAAVAADLTTEKVQTVAWDVSAGDPIVPQARMIEVPRVLGSPIELLGYAPETIVAEKGVTILQRGRPAPGGATTSTSSRSVVTTCSTTTSSPGRSRLWPSTGTSYWSRRPRCWSATAPWHSGSGRPGAGRLA